MRTELVTTLKRNATKLIDRLADDRESVMITQHGYPAAYLVDIETFHEMKKKMMLLEGLARGEKAVDEKRVISHAKAKKRMARWLN